MRDVAFFGLSTYLGFVANTKSTAIGAPVHVASVSAVASFKDDDIGGVRALYGPCDCFSKGFCVGGHVNPLQQVDSPSPPSWRDRSEKRALRSAVFVVGFMVLAPIPSVGYGLLLTPGKVNSLGHVPDSCFGGALCRNDFAEQIGFTDAVYLL